MNAIAMKNSIIANLAFIGSWLAEVLGGWDMMLKVLVAFMVIDYATGVIVAARFKKSNKSETGSLSSAAGFDGLLKKCAILTMVLVACLLDEVTGMTFIRTAVCLFYIANEALSILENTSLMGVPYPSFIKDMLDAMKKTADSGKIQKGGETNAK